MASDVNISMKNTKIKLLILLFSDVMMSEIFGGFAVPTTVAWSLCDA